MAYQAEKFKYRYPSDPSITTYFTLGNHDYLAESLCPRVRPILESRNDFKILGYCVVFVMWHGHIISIKHHVKGFDLRLPKKAEELSFKGHSHFYHIKSPRDNKCERVFIPAMCDDPGVVGEEQKFIKKNKLKTTPGFLTAEDFGECILITYFSFKYGTVIREDEYIKPITKKLIIK